MTLAGFRPPQALWKRSRGSVKRPSSDLVSNAGEDWESTRPSPAAADLSKQAAKLAACENPTEALALFDEAAWEMVLDAHDEDMRSGGLERIFPTAESARYSP